MTVTLKFPNTPGTAGTAWPGRGSGDASPSGDASLLGGFTRLDYEGWTTATNGRMSWELDPVDSGRVVSKFQVYGTDTADQFGGVRSTCWRNQDVAEGTTDWIRFGFFIPTGFVYPDTFFVIYQFFASPTGGNPAQALELRLPSAGGAERTALWWKCQQESLTDRTYFELGDVQENRWCYIVVQRYTTYLTSGWQNIWFAYDNIPNIADTPTAVWSGKTLYTSGDTGRDNILTYRDPGLVSQHQIVYYDEFWRGTTSDDVLPPYTLDPSTIFRIRSRRTSW